MATRSTALHDRTDIVLADPLGSFLDEVRTDLDQGTLPVRVFNDRDLHEREMERIFARCWVFVGHETEIPSPGDYVLRFIGDDQFILVRDEHGTIRVLLNKCMHRGSPVCRVDKGNASHFRCPYHSWVYKNTGEWNGAPFRRKGYKTFDTTSWGLLAAPHVDTVQGLVFASLDQDAPTLDEYLGDMRWYLDAIFGLSEQGMHVMGEPHIWRVPANWKSASENTMADAYHVPFLHRSGEDVGVFPEIDTAGAGGGSRHCYTDAGHGMILNPGWLPPPWDKNGYPPEVSENLRCERLTDEQKSFVQSYGTTTAMIFPNFALIRVPATPHPGALPMVFTYLQTYQPSGPDEMYVWNWTLAWNTAPESYNRDAYDAALAMHGSSGIFAQDDAVVWSGAPLAAKSAFARKNNMKLNFQLGFENPDVYSVDRDWAWPGIATTSALGEAPQRAFYRRWVREMSTP